MAQVLFEPGPILELHFTSRTPKRLFEALAGQPQLRRLRVKWGDYDDLDALADMVDLVDLSLGGASRVRSLDPLAGLHRLERLHIESLGYVRDLSPLRHPTSVTDLEVGGGGGALGSLTSTPSRFWPTCPNSATLSFIR